MTLTVIFADLPDPSRALHVIVAVPAPTALMFTAGTDFVTDLPLAFFILALYVVSPVTATIFEFDDVHSISLEDVLSYIDKLTDQGLIRIEVLKNDKDIMEEVVIIIIR